MKLNVAPLLGRFVAWTLVWAGIGAIAGGIMGDLMRGDRDFILTIMVATGSIVGAIGGATHAALAAVCEFASEGALTRDITVKSATPNGGLTQNKAT